MDYRRLLPVRFGDIDQAGILYFPRIYEYLHESWEDFWREALGRHYAGVLESERVGYPAVRIETEFRRPLRYGDELEIRIGVDRLGSRSVVWLYRGFRAGEEDPCLEARVTTACIDMDGFRSRPLPDTHRALFEPYLAEHA